VPTAVRTEQLTTTEAAVLALLAIEGERSGYDLLKLVQQSIAHIWSPARSGLYAVLPRLARNGLAAHRTRVQSARPDKQLYAITPAGRAALDQWLETVEPGARDTFFLKLFVGALTTPDVLLAHVEQFVADTEARLAELREIEPTNSNRGHDWFHRHMLRYGIDQAERELDWAAGVARALKRGPR
jgi:PadR family transcriptional regulator, regulatory protein AphA